MSEDPVNPEKLPEDTEQVPDPALEGSADVAEEVKESRSRSTRSPIQQSDEDEYEEEERAKPRLQDSLWLLRQPVYTLGTTWVGITALLNYRQSEIAVALSAFVFVLSFWMIQRCVGKIRQADRAAWHLMAIILWGVVAAVCFHYGKEGYASFVQ